MKSTPYPLVNLGAIMPVPSQALTVSYKNAPFRIDLDSGATVAFIREDIAMKLKLSINPNDQLALLAD